MNNFLHRKCSQFKLEMQNRGVKSFALCFMSCIAMPGCSYGSEMAPFVEFKYTANLTIDGHPYRLSKTYKCHYDFINPMRGKQWRVREGHGPEIQVKLSDGDQALLQGEAHDCGATPTKRNVITTSYIKSRTDPDLLVTSSLPTWSLGRHSVSIQDSTIETISRGEDKVLDQEGRRLVDNAKRERHIYFTAYVLTVPIYSITSPKFLDYVKQGGMRSIKGGTSFPFSGWPKENVNYARSFSYEFEKRDTKWNDQLLSDSKVRKYFGEADGTNWIVRRTTPSAPSYFRKQSKVNIDQTGKLVEPHHTPFWISYLGTRVEIFPPYDWQDFFDPERNELVRFSHREIALPF